MARIKIISSAAPRPLAIHQQILKADNEVSTSVGLARAYAIYSSRVKILMADLVVGLLRKLRGWLQIVVRENRQKERARMIVTAEGHLSEKRQPALASVSLKPTHQFSSQNRLESQPAHLPRASSATIQTPKCCSISTI
jgi:hypothetical protein